MEGGREGEKEREIIKETRIMNGKGTGKKGEKKEGKMNG